MSGDEWRQRYGSHVAFRYRAPLGFRTTFVSIWPQHIRRTQDLPKRLQERVQVVRTGANPILAYFFSYLVEVVLPLVRARTGCGDCGPWPAGAHGVHARVLLRVIAPSSDVGRRSRRSSRGGHGRPRVIAADRAILPVHV
jgi:hypothetical protein